LLTATGKLDMGMGWGLGGEGEWWERGWVKGQGVVGAGMWPTQGLICSFAFLKTNLRCPSS